MAGPSGREYRASTAGAHHGENGIVELAPGGIAPTDLIGLSRTLTDQLVREGLKTKELARARTGSRGLACSDGAAVSSTR
jgi:hypothetical protein